MDLGWPELLLIAFVVLVLFGSKKLPDAARSMGRSLRIFKAETRALHEDGAEENAAPSEQRALPTVAPAPVGEQPDTAIAAAPHREG